MEISIESGLAELEAKRVRYIWQMDRETYKQCQKIKDATGQYGWIPDLNLNTAGTFLGHQIALVDQPSFEVVIVTPADARVSWEDLKHGPS